MTKAASILKQICGHLDLQIDATEGDVQEAEQIAREKAQCEGVEPCRECRREVG